MPGFICDLFLVDLAGKEGSNQLEFNYVVWAKDVFACVDVVRCDLGQTVYSNHRIVYIQVDLDRDPETQPQLEPKIIRKYGPKEWARFPRKSPWSWLLKLLGR